MRSVITSSISNFSPFSPSIISRLSSSPPSVKVTSGEVKESVSKEEVSGYYGTKHLQSRKLAQFLVRKNLPKFGPDLARLNLL